MDSSHASENSHRMPEGVDCRLPWRPSGWLRAGLLALAAAAMASLWLSALPMIACAAGTALIAAYAAWRLWRESARKPFVLTWNAGQDAWQRSDGSRTQRLRHIGASLRGPLAVLTLADEDDRRQRIVWWPDTLDAGGRRALRLLAQSRLRPASASPLSTQAT